MANGQVIITVLDVGQGQCTFVEVYDTSNPPILIHTLLFDCGTDKKSTQTSINLQYIANKINGMATPKIDCIFFSHGDKDHIILTYALLPMLTPPTSTQKVIVEEVWYGGEKENYKKNNKNILNDLLTGGYCTNSNNIKSPTVDRCDYDSTAGTFTGIPLWQSTDTNQQTSVKVWSIAANALARDIDVDANNIKLRTAEAKNRVSIICGLYFGGSSYTICGDATNETMKAVAKNFKTPSLVFNQNIMTTLPHHGSRATGFAVGSTKTPSSNALKILNTFAKILNSKTITISAYEKHRHPSLELIRVFNPINKITLLEDINLVTKNMHLVTTYVDINISYYFEASVVKNWAYSFETVNNVFSTRYFNVFRKTIYLFKNIYAPNPVIQPSDGVVKGKQVVPFACWQYEAATNGNYTLGGYHNLNLPLELFTQDATGVSKRLESRKEELPNLMLSVSKKKHFPSANPTKPFSQLVRLKQFR